jgi:hypothetical protein
MVRREGKDGQKSSGHKRMEINLEHPFSLSPSIEVET